MKPAGRGLSSAFDSTTVPPVPWATCLSNVFSAMISPASGPAISVACVSKRYGAVESLRNVTFDVPRGAFLGIAGVNGAGKTTLIKCLLDATRPDSGDITVLGVPSTVSAARRPIAFLPERFNVPFYATGRDFLTLTGRLYGQAPEPGMIERIMVQLDLDTRVLDSPVRTYSKGMTQKLGISACLLSSREILILDEPTSGLDPKARALLKGVLRERHVSGNTIVITSHALADVDEMCDRLVILDGGVLQFDGTPATLRTEERATTLEAAFLARIDRSDGREVRQG